MKVAVAHRSLEVASAVRRIALRSGRNVLWVAHDMGEAFQRSRSAIPDLVLLDVSLAAAANGAPTRRLIAETSCTVVIMTPSRRGEMAGVYEAMEAGASDTVVVPRGDGGITQEVEAALLAKMDTVSKLRRGRRPASLKPRADAKNGTSPIVAFGASTGGPHALSRVLAGLPQGFDASILIVQHIGPEYMAGLAEQLGGRGAIPVRGAADGDRPTPGVALLASTGHHLVLLPDGTLAYREEPRTSLHRPSVDVLFQSLAANCAQPGVAVLLTGMGKDGALGMTRLRGLGWHTIAQDAATSVVDGMPRAAREAGAVEKVLPLDGIGPHIAQLVTSRRTRTA